MNILQTLSQALGEAFELVFRDLIIFVPKFLTAFVVLVILVWIAKIVSKLIGDLLRIARLDMLLAKIGVTQAFHQVGFQVSIAYAVQVFVKWVLLAVAFLSVFSILGLYEVVKFIEFGLRGVLPNIMTMTVMLFFTVVVANKVRDLVAHSSYVAKHHSPFLINTIWFSVVLFGTIATLRELSILPFITDAANGIIQALGLGVALALGLAFGLGCKEEARCLIRSWMGKECYDLDCGCNTFGCGNCVTGADDSHDHDCDCNKCEVKG